MKPAGQLVEVFTLHTDPDVNSADFCDLHHPHFGKCRSTSDSAIAWLLKNNRTRIFTAGIEWKGERGHHPDLPAGERKSKAHRLSIWRHTLDRLMQFPEARIAKACKESCFIFNLKKEKTQ